MFDATAAPTIRLLDDNGDLRKLADIEADVIRYAVRHKGMFTSYTSIANQLGIGRSTIYRKMWALGLRDR